MSVTRSPDSFPPGMINREHSDFQMGPEQISNSAGERFKNAKRCFTNHIPAGGLYLKLIKGLLVDEMLAGKRSLNMLPPIQVILQWIITGDSKQINVESAISTTNTFYIWRIAMKKIHLYWKNFNIKTKHMFREDIHGHQRTRMRWTGKLYQEKVQSEFINIILLILVSLSRVHRMETFLVDPCSCGHFHGLLSSILVLFGYSPDDVMRFINATNQFKKGPPDAMRIKSRTKLKNLSKSYFLNNQDFLC